MPDNSHDSQVRCCTLTFHSFGHLRVDRNSTLRTPLIKSSDWSVIATQDAIYNEGSIRVILRLLWIETVPDSRPSQGIASPGGATVGSGR